MTAYPNAVESLRCLAVESEPDAGEALNEAADVMADLLAALKRVTNELEFGGASMVAIKSMIDDARAAIAKATGKT